MVAVKAASVSGLSSWFKTPAGVGSSPLQISSKLVAVFGPKLLIASPLSTLSCIEAHSGVSGIFHKAIFPLASPRIKNFIHLPSLEKIKYLKAGGQCSGGPGLSMTSSQKSIAEFRDPPPASVLDLFKNCLLSTMQLVGSLYR